MAPLLFIAMFHEYFMLEQNSLPSSVVMFLKPLDRFHNQWCTTHELTFQYVGEVTFADGNAIVIPFRSPKEVAVRLAHVFVVLDMFGLRTNFDKSCLLLVPAGKGSSMVCRSIGILVVVRGWGSIPVLRKAKHLGSYHVDIGSFNVEVDFRLGRAKAAYARVSRRVLHSSFLSLHLRLRVFRCLVLSVLFFHIVLRVLYKRQLVRIERFQARCFRAMCKSPSHIYRVRNVCIREFCGIHNISSVVVHRRLLWWHNVLASPAFAGFRSVFLGRFPFSDSPLLLLHPSPRLRQLRDDLLVLRRCMRYVISPRLAARSLCIDDINWFVLLAASSLSCVLSFRSDVDLPSVEGAGVSGVVAGAFQCAHCTVSRLSYKQLIGHMWCAHDIRDLRREHVNEVGCPACHKQFIDVIGAQVHFQKFRCAESLEYVVLVRAQIASSIGSGPPGLSIRFFFPRS